MATFTIVKRGRPKSRGELHWNAKVTDRQRLEIIRRWNQGESARAIALRFGVNASTVVRIVEKGIDNTNAAV
jgi:DNA invertase Pin-like site-specific DNA recombinase